jgi:UPF0755 protein
MKQPMPPSRLAKQPISASRLAKPRIAAPRLALLFLLLALSCGGVLGFGAVQVSLSLVQAAGSASSPMVLFVIQPGETTGQIADQLEQQGIIRSALMFKLWARFENLDTRLEAGSYHLSAAMTIPQIVDLLLQARPDGLWVVIPEGYRISQIAQTFATSGLTNFNPADFLRIAQTGDFEGVENYWFLRHAPQGISGSLPKMALEGYLFPAKYLVPVTAQASDVIKLMLNAFGQQLCPGPASQPDAYLASERQCEAHARTLDQSSHQTVFDLLRSHYSSADGASMADKLYHALTIASIVEREARTHADRQGITSVYYNRYLVGKHELTPPEAGLSLLQADPTLQYALGTNSTPWPPLQQGGSTYHLGPYDTYQNPGLPPGPICSPGADALAQAINPEKTSYFYFITGRDGTTHYARNYAEQQQNIARYGAP